MEAHLERRVWAQTDLSTAVPDPAPGIPVPLGWHIVWWALAVAAVGSLSPHSVFQGPFGFLAFMGLVCAAGYQWLRARRFLSRKESAFAFVVLFSFVSTQTVYHAWANGPQASIFGFDFSAYYLAAKIVPTRVEGRLYQLPLYPDGRVNLNVGALRDSGWHRAAQQWGVPFSAPFIYPPFLAVLLRPLGRLPFRDAFLTWRVCMACCYLGGIVLSFGAARSRPPWRTVPLWCVALLSYYPFLEGLVMGQGNNLVFLLLAASMWFLAREHTAGSAFCFAAAALIKLTPLLALPVFIIHRKWKWLFASAAWLGVLLGFSIQGAGWAAHRHFFHDVLPRLSSGTPVVSNTSVVAYVQELCLGQVYLWQDAPATLPAHVGSLSRAVGFAVYAAGMVLVYLKRRDRACLRDFAAVILLSFLVSPISWWHHYTIALMPFLYLWNAYPERTHRLLLALFTAVATNFAGFGRLVATSPPTQLTLAAIVPALVLAVFLTTLLRSGINAYVPADARSR